ncbi:synaptotagmin-15-like [Centruroides vittatus]|uniref:synaptotagmin-15-like n=1 Tax=Centruroides vittatus TaxID=120091 RepID=UPI00350F133B
MKTTTIAPQRTEWVSEKPINNIYLWITIGCSVGGALILALLISFWYYLRKRPKIEKPVSPVPELNSSSEMYQTKLSVQNSPPTFSSSGSEDVTDPLFLYRPPSSRRSTLVQSASLDLPSHPRLTSECVQPRPVLSRWHTIGSPTYLGTVQPDLYRVSDEEDTNIPPCIHGRIWFTLLYKEDEEQLEVNIIRAKYLTGRGLNNTPRDPFVKLYLLPDEENFQQSKVRKRTLAPKFHEIFTFQVKKDELTKRTLRISVYDVDKRRVRHCLGHVIVTLSRVDLTTNDVLWRDLESASQPSSLGEIQVSLSCNPFNSRIKITVCRLKNIRGIDTSEAGIYAKVQLHHGRKILKSKKTALKHLNLPGGEVIFDETFTFAITAKYFDSCHLTITVVIAGPTPLVKDDPQGKVVLGPFLYARGEQLLQWQEMIANPRNPVTKWHNLEPIT